MNARSMKKVKLRQSQVSKLAHRFGLPGNLGNIATAQKIAKIQGAPIPISKRQCREFLFFAAGSVPHVTPYKERRKPQPIIDPNSDAFLQSYEWRALRMQALKRDGARCQCCGATPDDGVKMHVDHIKPRRKFPHLALDLNNLQVLCEVCNHGKGNWDETDWRKQESVEVDYETVRFLKSL
jgi:HNH endonuclease